MHGGAVGPEKKAGLGDDGPQFLQGELPGEINGGLAALCQNFLDKFLFVGRPGRSEDHRQPHNFLDILDNPGVTRRRPAFEAPAGPRVQDRELPGPQPKRPQPVRHPGLHLLIPKKLQVGIAGFHPQGPYR